MALGRYGQLEYEKAELAGKSSPFGALEDLQSFDAEFGSLYPGLLASDLFENKRQRPHLPQRRLIRLAELPLCPTQRFSHRLA